MDMVFRRVLHDFPYLLLKLREGHNCERYCEVHQGDGIRRSKKLGSPGLGCLPVQGNPAIIPGRCKVYEKAEEKVFLGSVSKYTV